MIITFKKDPVAHIPDSIQLDAKGLNHSYLENLLFMLDLENELESTQTAQSRNKP